MPLHFTTAVELGVKIWINGCRSGDYVGRYLLHKGPTDAWIPSTSVPLKSLEGHQEFCLGEGAHVHHFTKPGPP